MLYYDMIDVSEGIDVNETSEYDVCHYWYFLNFSFKFQPNVCNRRHGLMMSVNFSISNIKGFDYCCIISLICIKFNEAINLMQNADLTRKSGTL